MPDALAQAEFDDPSIEREYRRWRNKLGGAFPSEPSTIDAGETLYAHFLIAQYFADEGRGLGGIGPRDDGHLLHSALSRQFVEFGGIRKWSDDLQIAATTLFGLIKNHPFHDGNKRTALLSILRLLQKQGRTASARQNAFDDFVVEIAESAERGGDNEIERIADATWQDDASRLSQPPRFNLRETESSSVRFRVQIISCAQQSHRHRANQ